MPRPILLLMLAGLLFGSEAKSISKGKDAASCLPQPMPNGMLAFPETDQSYAGKITWSSGPYKIWNQNRILAWSLAQGFSATEDTQLAGSPQCRRGAIFHAPGLHFRLKLPATAEGDRSAFGWQLILDMGFLRPAVKSDFLSSNYKRYENILRYQVYIDGIHYRELEIGFGKTIESPVVIPIPFARDPEGIVKVEIRMSNQPQGFGILYDAMVVRRR